MTPEQITWHILPTDGLPDAEVSVLAEFVHADEPDHADTWPAWWSGEHWIDATTGDRLERDGRCRVLAWCHMPAGSRAAA